MHSSIFATLFIYRNVNNNIIHLNVHNTFYTLVTFRHLKIVVYKKGLNAFQIHCLKLVLKKVCMHAILFIHPSGALIYFSDTSEISCVIVELNRTYLLQYYSSIQTHLKIIIKLTIHELAKSGNVFEICSVEIYIIQIISMRN